MSLGTDTIFFIYFVRITARWLHVVAVAILTGSIALILFAIFVLDHPFGGDLRVGPEAFDFVAGKIEGNGTQ